MPEENRVIALLGVALTGLAAPASAQTAEDAANEAYRLYAAQDYSGAARAAQLAVDRDPANEAYRLLLADALAQSGEQAVVPAILDPADTGYPTQSRLAEAYFATRDWIRAAEAYRLAAIDAPDDARRSYSLRAEALSLIQAGDREQAAAIVRKAHADPALNTGASLDWAMIAIAAGEDRLAQEILGDTAIHAQFTRQSALDAAYSAKRVMLDQRAVHFFELGLALDDGSPEKLSTVDRFAIQREIATLSRHWLFNGQVSYGETERLPGFLNLPASADRTAQAGAEIGYRVAGWRNGRPFTVFARAFGAVDAGSGSGTEDAVQGWIGIQHKPLSDLNLVIEASRLIALGGPALDDWSIRTAFSATTGLEPDPVRTDWPFRDLYADLAYFVEADAALGVVNARYGHSFAQGDAARPLVITPFVVSQLSYDSIQPEVFALGAGAGIGVRQWLGGKSLRAPVTHVELSAQARTHIAGNQRAGGIYATLGFGF